VLLWQESVSASPDSRRESLALACASGLLLGSAVLMKNEGAVAALLWCVVGVGAPALRDRARRRLGLACALSVLPFAAAFVAFKRFVPVNELVAGGGLSFVTLERAGVVAHRFVLASADVFRFRAVFLVVSALGVAAWLARRAARENDLVQLRSVLVFVWLTLAAYFCVYLITPQDLRWHLATSVDRLFLQLYPCATLAFVMLLARRGRDAEIP
jgi:hypothetical protein